ncbi:LytR/AlgR family response regulator transcription factor [Egicoccus sp. AB-alg2]|uniref:LytR/AlgR family response regulator transcription factor n=1 Tax=Egicoccus sp. AB-alg2 TaxID=3242693 RepID=UPI00359D73C6
MGEHDEAARPARCLLVDDESPARDELRFLLSEVDGVVVVGEAATAEEAQALLDSIEYDVLFLDVRMPGMGGLELARALRERERSPAVIFTTAYPEHAVTAFDLEAVDYLVKPFDDERLHRALERALEHRSGTAANPSRPSPARGAASASGAVPSSGAAPGSAPPGVAGDPPGHGRHEVAARIPVHKGDRVILVDERQVLYAHARRGYAELRTGDATLLASFTLQDLERRLSSDFCRTHRSYLVNLRHVREVLPMVGGALELVMADRSRVPVSRRQATDVRRRLGM